MRWSTFPSRGRVDRMPTAPAGYEVARVDAWCGLKKKD